MSWGCPGMIKCSKILVFPVAFIDTLPWTLLNTQKVKLKFKMKASSANKEIAKTCLIVDMVRKNESRITVAGSGLYYFVLAPFGSSWNVVSFSAAEKFKYLLLTAMKFHTIARIVKKQNNFIFSSLVT